jgi:hypothetical protein
MSRLLRLWKHIPLKISTFLPLPRATNATRAARATKTNRDGRVRRVCRRVRMVDAGEPV